MTKELPAFFLAAMFIVAATTAFGAERYPSKPVRLIVLFAPGGSVDIVTKEIIAHLNSGVVKVLRAPAESHGFHNRAATGGGHSMTGKEKR